MQVNVSKQCERGLITLKRNPFADFFYTPLTIDSPCLLNIEKNIRNYKYKSLYEWIMDLRKMWAYFFTYYANNQEIYHKTSSLSQDSENIYRELENKSKDKDEMSEINRKIDTLQKDIQNIRGNPTFSNVAPPNKKNDKYTLSIMDRAMTKNEKSALGLAIQTLHPSQMGGLIRIINDMVDIKDKTSLELDIDSLPTRKLRELEKYIKTCNKAKKDSNYHHNNKHNNNHNNHSNNIESSNIHKLKTGLSQPTPKNASTTMSNSANSNNDKKEPDKKEKGLLNENDSISSSDSGKFIIYI